jgi:hypothetical protein
VSPTRSYWIQRRILDAYAAHGYETETDYSRTSRFLAAGSARKATRTARLLIESASALTAAKRWVTALGSQHHTEHVDDDDEDED